MPSPLSQGRGSKRLRRMNIEDERWSEYHYTYSGIIVQRYAGSQIAWTLVLAADDGVFPACPQPTFAAFSPRRRGKRC